ncbi:SH2 domain protein [Aphelenchoides bicaudatus]|nr:SH2 domain protein [Aphelenchoides bicaudatus]
MNRLSMSGLAEMDRRPSLVSSEIIKQLDDTPNLSIEQYPWFFGQLDRHEAKIQLGINPDGTFLVRQSRNQSQYALSILFNGHDKHILIEMDSESRLYYLHGGRYFHSIPSLINYYRAQSLEEGFNDLATLLKGTPLRNTVFRAKYAFVFQSDTTRYLKLEQGDLVRVLDTNGEENGWWKGISHGITGYFPLQYVTENNGEFENGVENEAAQPTEVY